MSFLAKMQLQIKNALLPFSASQFMFVPFRLHIPGPASVWDTNPSAAISEGCQTLCVSVVGHFHGDPLLADCTLLLRVADILHPDKGLTLQIRQAFVNTVRSRILQLLPAVVIVVFVIIVIILIMIRIY